jgi:membrane protein YdbS with pleckstrin-like domain
LPFKDRYPTTLEFEIDRGQLLRYWRLQAIIGCCGATLPFSFAIGMSLFRFHLESNLNLGVLWKLSWFVLYFIAGFVAGLVVGGVIYFAMCHVPAKRAAANLRLMVEGPFLRIVSGGYFVTDRRIHFRAISDYSIQEGPLLKQLGMKSLSFRVMGSAQGVSQSVAGLVNPEEVRDQLCEIDASRENAEA